METYKQQLAHLVYGRFSDHFRQDQITKKKEWHLCGIEIDQGTIIVDL